MRKHICLCIFIFFLCASFPGCGKTGNGNDDSQAESTTAPGASGVAPGTSPRGTDTSPVTPTKKPGQTDSGTDSKQTPEITTEATTGPELKTGNISTEQDYSDAERIIKVLGLKEYKKIKGEKFTDTPGKGKKYLVLFLSIKNNTGEENYINYNYFEAKLDGKKTEHTFLLNDPKNYPTIFTHIQPNGSIAGFIVWEVPDKWKKLRIKYNGWKDTDSLSLSGEFTPEDLSDPVLYNANDYQNTSQIY